MPEQWVFSALEVARGPLFRFALALMLLGMLRLGLLALSDVVGAYLSTRDKAVFWGKLRLRVLWIVAPTVVLRRLHPQCAGASFAGHLALCIGSLVFRLAAVILPAFLVAHVYLWKRGLGLSWPVISGRSADVLAWIVIVLGLVLFLGRLYSPMLRRIEPPWSFLKPLVLLPPFLTGLGLMHPTWSPFDYHVVLLLHVISGVLVLILVPAARLLACMHRRLPQLMPDTQWCQPPDECLPI